MLAAPACVVFDANPYRALFGNSTPAKAVEVARALKARESESSVVAAAAPSVVIELCKHLADPNDVDFDICLPALCALVEHCTYSRDGLRCLRLLPHTEQFLCEPMYGSVPPIIAENSLQVRLAAHCVATSPTRDGLARNASAFAVLSRVVDAVESAYADSLRTLTNGADLTRPGARSEMRRRVLGIEGRSMAAGLLVRRARAALGIDDVQDPLYAHNALWVAEAYGVAVDFMVNALAQMLDGANPDNKRNSFWDGELAFFVGANCVSKDDGTGIDARPIVVVSGDRDLRRASKLNTNPNCCQTLAEYRARIGWQRANGASQSNRAAAIGESQAAG